MRLIDADELKIDYGFTWGDIVPTHDEMYALIDRQPTIKPEQKNGKWLDPSREGIVTYSSAYAECSECGKKIFSGRMMNYCPNCGSYNGGEQHETN